MLDVCLSKAKMCILKIISIFYAKFFFSDYLKITLSSLTSLEGEMNYVPGAPGALVNQSAEPPTVSNITPPLQLQPTLQASTVQQVWVKI